MAKKAKYANEVDQPCRECGFLHKRRYLAGKCPFDSLNRARRAKKAEKRHEPVKQSPTPWSVEDDGHLDHEGKIWLVDSRGLCVAEFEVNEEAVITPKEAEENADAIASAVNCRAALVALVRQYRKEALEQGAAVEDVKEIDAALKAAGEAI